MTKENTTFIIAELSANHNGSLQTALDSVKAAKEIGVDAIKIQTYTADTLTIDCEKDDFIIKGETLWDGKKLYHLYKEAYTPWEWQKQIFEYANSLGLICFSSPFDKSSIDFLEGIGNPIYKIASFEIQDIPLIRYAASKGKPMIISTGIAELADIELAVKTCREVGNNDITLLKCTSAYPAPIKEANLIMMKEFESRFKVKVGLSDHTLGTTLPIAAVAMGAQVIEKHGKVDYTLTDKQITNKRFGRSLYVVEDVKAGELFTEKNIRSIRPGFGMHPKYLEDVLGEKACCDIEKGTALSDRHLGK